MLPRVASSIADLGEFFRTEWPTSFATWLPAGPRRRRGRTSPTPRWRGRGAGYSMRPRRGAAVKRQIEAAREAFYMGFVARRWIVRPQDGGDG